ncbi:lysosomal membrane ascorbate-dependent ferrireductase CYB561A3-like [Centroberyx affinis]|uniref:lysosomal membrane ascorbate-dependent ferrireductase CYB561A3-like n=1 Tax=Centroberyx affinis TaxID=166261 RepID=UPI003A5C5892
MRSSLLFYVTYLLCLCLGLLCVLFVSYWNSHWRGGFAWDGSSLQSHWHPVLMVSGLVVLYGHAVIVYRVPFTWKQRKHTWKLVHAGLMLLVLLLSILGLCAVFDLHTGLHLPDLYSLHSWVGICTVVMFVFQWVLGLAAFLLPCSPLWFRKALKPAHTWMGNVIFILSLASCISGINEKLLLNINGSSAGTCFAPPVEAKFANFLGILIVAFGLVVFGILSKNKWQRPEVENESSQGAPSWPVVGVTAASPALSPSWPWLPASAWLAPSTLPGILLLVALPSMNGLRKLIIWLYRHGQV